VTRSVWLLVLALSAIPFLGWWSYGLFDLDEGFYAAVTAEMNRRGEWIIPYYNGEPWFEKPILLYWVAKPFVALFGPWAGPRLPAVLASLATLAIASAYASRRLSPGSGGLVALILASSLLFVGAGRMMLTDGLLVLCITVAFLAFWESLVGDRRWRSLAAACLGLSVLAKGPVGVALFLPLVGYAWWRERDLRTRFRGGWFSGVAIALAVVACWYVPAYLRAGDLFVQQFLIEQNIGRFAGGDEAHRVPMPAGLVFYVPILLAGMIPWSMLIVRAWPGRRDAGLPSEEAALRRFLAAWGLVVFLFFTISGSKLVHYVLPAVIPFAMLIGDWLNRAWGDGEWLRPRRFVPIGLWVLIVAGLAHGGMYYYYGTFHREIHRLTLWVGEQGGDVAVFQMPRRAADPGTGRPVIQETSHPSIPFYLDSTVVAAETMDQLLEHPGPLWILTRSGRIDDEEMLAAAAAGRALVAAEPPFPERHYAVYRLGSAAGE
jgi:4-amino-4-deoxy-L-arabinose transferase-like glycosyltransferase